jgi:hypothetical protein
MSLKAFHILFIILATILALGFGAWAITQYSRGQASGLDLGLGIVSLILVPVLIAYGRYVLRKLKNVSYL